MIHTEPTTDTGPGRRTSRPDRERGEESERSAAPTGARERVRRSGRPGYRGRADGWTLIGLR